MFYNRRNNWANDRLTTMIKARSADEILDKLEQAFTYYHESHDASAGTARLEFKQALHASLVELLDSCVGYSDGETKHQWVDENELRTKLDNYFNGGQV